MRIGRRRAGIPVWFVGLALLAAALSAGSPFAWADRKKPEGGASAIVGGSVFRDAGFALRGAEVTATLAAAASPGAEAGIEAAAPSKKQKKPAMWKAASDARGEFILRLPAGPGRYNVTVRAVGYKPQEKQVTFAADERQDLTFLLESDRSVK